MQNKQEITSGVQELINKLKNNGVIEGQKQAEVIINEAHTKASQILLQAQKEADQLLSNTKQKIEMEQKASHEALKIAFRDSEITLRSKLRDAFSAHLKRLVSLELNDKDFIKQLILAIACAKSSEIEPVSPIEILFKGDPQEEKASLHHLVLGITHDMLREGIELIPSLEIHGGIKVKLVGKDMEIDLTDNTLSNLLLKYLLPRYREIISGQD